MGRSPAITGALSSPALLRRWAEPQQKPRLRGFAAGENCLLVGVADLLPLSDLLLCAP